MIYYMIRNDPASVPLNVFRSTPSLFELLSEAATVLSYGNLLDPTGFNQIVIQYD